MITEKSNRQREAERAQAERDEWGVKDTHQNQGYGGSEDGRDERPGYGARLESEAKVVKKRRPKAEEEYDETSQSAKGPS